MMDQAKWNKLNEAFDTEENWWEPGANNDYDLGIDLFDWLDCSTSRPSGTMIQEFNNHGYDVECYERDSFGWLVAGVKEKKSGKVILFG